MGKNVPNHIKLRVQLISVHIDLSKALPMTLRYDSTSLPYKMAGLALRCRRGTWLRPHSLEQLDLRFATVTWSKHSSSEQQIDLDIV